MNFINIDFITNSSSSNYIAIVKNKKKFVKMGELNYFRKSFGISEESSLDEIVKYIDKNKELLKESNKYKNRDENEIRELLINDYGIENAGKIQNALKSNNKNVYIIHVNSGEQRPYIQELIMYEDHEFENRSLTFIRREYGV